MYIRRRNGHVCLYALRQPCFGNDRKTDGRQTAVFDDRVALCSDGFHGMHAVYFHTWCLSMTTCVLMQFRTRGACGAPCSSGACTRSCFPAHARSESCCGAGKAMHVMHRGIHAASNLHVCLTLRIELSIVPHRSLCDQAYTAHMANRVCWLFCQARILFVVRRNGFRFALCQGARAVIAEVH